VLRLVEGCQTGISSTVPSKLENSRELQLLMFS